MKWFEHLKQKARELKKEIYTLYLCYKDFRTPWYAKAMLIFVLGYALSPIDLIPDFIPLLGYLDDLIIVPLGIRLCIRLIPPEVYAENKLKASVLKMPLKKNYVFAIIFCMLWIVLLVWFVFIMRKIICRL